PSVTSLPPIYVCLDCQTQPLLVTTEFQIQAVIFLGGVITLLGAMSFTLLLFANARMLRSPVFWGSNGALLITTSGLVLFLVELLPGAIPSLRSMQFLRVTCARRFFTQVSPWAWSVLLLGKLFAFYPRSIRERRHTVILWILIVLKFRILLDLISLGLLCGGISKGHGFTVLATAFYFPSVVLDVLDNLIVSTILFKTSYEFYKKARLRLSTNSRRIRLIFESVGMTFCGAIPPQLLYGIGMMISFFKPDYFSSSQQYWVALWMFSSLGIFGILSTTWSSIDNVPNKCESGSPQGSVEFGQDRYQQPPEDLIELDRRGSLLAQRRFSTHSAQLRQHQQQQQHVAAESGWYTPTIEPTETLLSIFLVEAAGSGSDPSDEYETMGERGAAPGLRSRRASLVAVPNPPVVRQNVLHRRRWLQLGSPPSSPASDEIPKLPRR
ncbi:hypothetical protein V8E36_003465, partial [Tilletia maclaganii]